jgi:hypothetical protein
MLQQSIPADTFALFGEVQRPIETAHWQRVPKAHYVIVWILELCKGSILVRTSLQSQLTRRLVHFRYVLGCLNWVLRLTKSAAV